MTHQNRNEKVMAAAWLAPIHAPVKTRFHNGAGGGAYSSFSACAFSSPVLVTVSLIGAILSYQQWSQATATSAPSSPSAEATRGSSSPSAQYRPGARPSSASRP